jgi:glycosyltransferase involved in cell wall biosynthesis
MRNETEQLMLLSAGPTLIPNTAGSGRMRIAQIAPLYESCPPKLYGGTERVVSWLTEELVRQGHDVTLFASGDSHTNARLVSASRRALRLDWSVKDPLAHPMTMLDRVVEQEDQFDILHFHTDYLHFPLTRLLSCPSITTLHGRQDLADLVPVYQRFKHVPLVSISDAQRTPLPFANWRRTIHHGLPKDLLAMGQGKGGYLAFIGRISPEKRLDRAIEIARAVGMPLKVAAKVDNADKAYFERVISPLLDDPTVEFIGEIGDSQKSEFLGNAAALLFPIDWPEPFGLVMIEAMACGTPVLAFDCGSVREILEPGVSGAIVSSVDEAIAKLPTVIALDRRAVRREFESRFSVEIMACAYVALYKRMRLPMKQTIEEMGSIAKLPLFTKS